MSSFFCSPCCRSFKRKENLDKHTERLHSDVVSVFLCGICEQTCSTFFNLKTHHSRFHKGRKFEDIDMKVVKRMAQNKRCAVVLERLDLDPLVFSDSETDTEYEKSAENIGPVAAESISKVSRIETMNCSVVLTRLDPDRWIGIAADSAKNIEPTEPIGNIETESAANDIETELALMFGATVDMTETNVEFSATSENLEGILSDPTEDVENVLPMHFIAVDGCQQVDHDGAEGLTNRDPLSNDFRTNSIWVRRNFTKTISDAAAQEKESRKRQLVIYDLVDDEPRTKNRKTSTDIDEFLTVMRE